VELVAVAAVVHCLGGRYSRLYLVERATIAVSDPLEAVV
jgi:hypothetical protein